MSGPRDHSARATIIASIVTAVATVLATVLATIIPLIIVSGNRDQSVSETVDDAVTHVREFIAPSNPDTPPPVPSPSGMTTTPFTPPPPSPVSTVTPAVVLATEELFAVPSEGPAGESFKVFGENFWPGTSVSITPSSGETGGSTVADENGMLSFDVNTQPSFCRDNAYVVTLVAPSDSAFPQYSTTTTYTFTNECPS